MTRPRQRIIVSLMQRCAFLGIWLAGLLGTATLMAGCGDDGRPAPGYVDPCDTALGTILGCVPNPRLLGDPAKAEDACAKLVSCGILADLRKSGDNHSLDYAWCIDRLLGGRNDPCDGHRYSGEELRAATQCINTTPCTALGLPLGDKFESSSNRSELDLLTCAGGDKTVWTATTCDNGILRY